MKTAFVSWLTMTFLCGCAGYRLGPTNGLTAGSQSIQVNPFSNETLEPRLSDPVTTALRRNFQKDGTFRVDTRGGGDIILTGVLVRYERDAISFQPRDILTGRDFEVRVVAKVTATERSSGRLLLDREVVGRTAIRSGADLPSAERQAAPVLADDLARNITSLLVDGTW
jgi:hypothetical protein